MFPPLLPNSPAPVAGAVLLWPRREGRAELFTEPGRGARPAWKAGRGTVLGPDSWLRCAEGGKMPGGSPPARKASGLPALEGSPALCCAVSVSSPPTAEFSAGGGRREFGDHGFLELKKKNTKFLGERLSRPGLGFLLWGLGWKVGWQ